MASSKAALKAIKTSLDGSRFASAAEQAEDFLKKDKENHTACLFLGFAREKLGDLDAAEKALLRAADVKPDDVQAYKGLVNLYEKQGSAKLDQYHKTVFRLAEIYAHKDDRAECQTVIDKYELFAKKHGSRAQYRRALELILPTSNLYPTLEGRVLQPSLAYLRILESAEAEEKEWINTQIGERRTRLGAKIDQVTRQVKYEAIAKFQIEAKLAALIDWTRDDDARHDLEQKLLQRMFDNLLVLPQESKPEQRDNILHMANGMVIIKQPFPLAWRIALDWVDAEELLSWDVNIFREFIAYFPEEGLGKVLRGFLDSEASPFPRPAVEEKEGEDVPERLTEADQLILMSEGLEDCPDSLLGHRIMATVYLHLKEWQSTVDVARKAQKLHLDAERRYAIDLQNSVDGVNLILANALITFQSPRNHPEAKDLFQDILNRKPMLTPALLGIGLIYEEDEDYTEAVKFFEQAAERDPANIRIKLELAWCRAHSGQLQQGLEELQAVLAAIESTKPQLQDLAMKSVTLYRIGYCLWHLGPSDSARKAKSGPYSYLIASAKANPAYAPAYTLLGVYFQDYAKRQARARTALQKAFELSTSELDAAHRLAQTFASTGEWDLVELVATRVVNSGKARPGPGSKKKAHSWPYAALGVVQMNKQHYTNAIVSFQHALRIKGDDYFAWVGLGESYHNAGRHVAATRAFAKAESVADASTAQGQALSAEDTWFAKYMLANVQREMGAFDEAITAYEEVLALKPGEFGVLIALLQTVSESAWAKVALGMFGEAAKLAGDAIDVAAQIAHVHVNVFNLWKAVGDACSVLGHVKVYANSGDTDKLLELLQVSLHDNDFKPAADVDDITIDSLTTISANNPSAKADKYIIASILAHKRAIHASSDDHHAQAVAWYNLGWAEHQAFISGGPSLNAAAAAAAQPKKARRFLKAAMTCFKHAIELEAGNAEIWNALGVVTMTLSPQVSQHSFVRSLHLNDHSARTWTNLGVLYLVNNDNQLANEAFTRAQSEDPEYADAWIGQGLLATLFGSLGEARGLFMHAFEIADSSVLPAKRHYAVSAFDHLLKDAARSQEVSALLRPLFALRQFHTQEPADMIATHLMALVAERAGDYPTSAEALQEVCDSAEADYETSESTESLVRFAQAKADLARAQLASGQFAESVASAETAIDLSGEVGELDAAYSDSRRKWRLSAYITAGLAHSHLKQIEPSIKMFQVALDESNREPDVVCMLAQVLWAKGGNDEKEAARTQLFDVVENHPDHVQAIALLAVTGLLDNDEDVLEAVEEDLKALRRGDEIGVLDKIEVSKVLAGIVGCRPRQTGTDAAVDQVAVVGDALNGIMLAPGQPQGWLELAQATGANEDGGGAYAAELAVLNAERLIPPGGNLAAEDLARAYEGTSKTEDFLRAKMLTPWRLEIAAKSA